MTDQPLRIERRASGIYPVLFHAGPYYWPVSEDAVTRLSNQTSSSPTGFREALFEAFAVTPYLKHQLELVLSGLDNPDEQLRAFQSAIRAQ